MNATIITIGDELLIGQVIETNSAFIASELGKAGISVKRKIVTGDEEEEIISALNQAKSITDLILITGGLGPTKDDITKHTLCRYFGGRLIRNNEILEMVEGFFKKLNRPMLEVNANQADLPDNCIPIKNNYGTAPGMWFQQGEKVFVSMPGVPFEMKPMLVEVVIPKLQEYYSNGNVSNKLPVIIHRTIHTQGIGESFLAEQIKDIEASIPVGLKLAYLPHYSIVRLRISASGQDEKRLKEQVASLEKQIQSRVGEFIFGYDDTSLEKEIGIVMASQKKTLTTAESMTGGLIAHKISLLSDASQYYKGSLVTYATETKEHLLGVKNKTLKLHGVVSEETVREMVEGVLKVMQADCAVSVSGIAGPTGGTKENPVGTVWIGVGDKEKIIAKRFQFSRSREIIIEYSAITALAMLWRFITGKL